MAKTERIMVELNDRRERREEKTGLNIEYGCMLREKRQMESGRNICNVLGLSDFEYSFSLLTKLSKSCWRSWRFCKERFWSSGL